MYAGKTVFVYINYYWCVTCKFNKIMGLESIMTLYMFQKKSIVMWGDFTSQDDKLYSFLTYHDIVGMPFCIKSFLS